MPDWRRQDCCCQTATFVLMETLERETALAHYEEKPTIDLPHARSEDTAPQTLRMPSVKLKNVD